MIPVSPVRARVVLWLLQPIPCLQQGLWATWASSTSGCPRTRDTLRPTASSPRATCCPCHSSLGPSHGAPHLGALGCQGLRPLGPPDALSWGGLVSSCHRAPRAGVLLGHCLMPKGPLRPVGALTARALQTPRHPPVRFSVCLRALYANLCRLPGGGTCPVRATVLLRAADPIHTPYVPCMCPTRAPHTSHMPMEVVENHCPSLEGKTDWSAQ